MSIEGEVLSLEFIRVGLGSGLFSPRPAPDTTGEIQAVGVGKDW